MKKIIYMLIAALAISVQYGCKDGGLSLSGEKPVFTLTDSSETGFFFWNEINETEQLNSLNYGYFYLGGGVAIGDINNDGLPDIYMVGNTFGGRLFLNKGGLKFEQISNTSNTYVTGWVHGVTMADVNNDGYLDIYLSRSMSAADSQRSNVLLINNKDNTFTDKAKEYGIDDIGFTMHSNFFDYDKDGDLDLYVLNHKINLENALVILTKEQRAKEFAEMDNNYYKRHASKLYRNNGDGTYTDVTKEAGVLDVFYGLSATVADVNNDGWPDLYTSADFANKDHLFINNQNGTFTDKIHNAFGHISLNSMGSEISDFNNDGLLDVVTLDMMAEDNYRYKQLKGSVSYDIFKTGSDYGYHTQVIRNCLQKNNGDGTFSEIGQLAGVSHTDWSWAPLLADFNNDGKKDLFISNGYPKNTTDMDYIHYKSDEIIKAAGGLDKVKHLDLLASMGSTPLQNYIYKNNGDYKFENKATEWGLIQKAFSNGSAYADLDLDGDLDLVVNNFNAPSFLYRNNTIENGSSNQFISFLFKPEQHARVQGTKVKLITTSGIQYQELTNNRGFLSTMQQILHFGTPKGQVVSRVEITYPDNTIQEISSPTMNTHIVLDINNGKKGVFPQEEPVANLFQSAKGLFSPDAVHTESKFIDYKEEPLLEEMYSNKGPHISVGDVNGDGLEDFYFGASAGYAATLYLQNQAGRFIARNNAAFTADKGFEDGQAVFIDVDSDNDLDLYVCSGSNEQQQQDLLIDRLYINDGTGNFSRGNTIPNVMANTQSVKALDIDGDKDMDLVIGGAVQAGLFPLCHKSYILVNNNGTFTVKKDGLPQQGDLGMINDIATLDINNDNQTDIIMVGEWMPITVLINQNGIYKNQSKEYGFEKSNGLWNTILVDDVNKDGTPDLLVGNRGLNNFFGCSPEQPATLYFNDFDENGDQEAIINYYFRDKILYPAYSLKELLEQLPSWRGKFPRYENYSKATAGDIFSKSEYPSMKTWYCHTFSSMLFLGNGKAFTSVELPIEAQVSPIKSFCKVATRAGDFILSVGNNYSTNVTIGQFDAGRGNILRWKKKENKLENSTNPSWNVAGDTRGIKKIKSANGEVTILVSVNNTGIKSFKLQD